MTLSVIWVTPIHMAVAALRMAFPPSDFLKGEAGGRAACQLHPVLRFGAG